MKKERGYPKAIVTPKGERAIQNGHPWVYGAEVLPQSDPLPDGELADVVSQSGRYLGTGLVCLASKIRVRLISRNANDTFDPAFWERRLRYAVDYRRTVMGDQFGCCRLIFGEADSFPGLTVDRFGDILVTQTLSLGMDRLKPLLFPLLCRVLAEGGEEIRGVYERNDAAIRQLEGLPQGKGFFPVPGLEPPARTRTIITENGIRYHVDFENGQKTGFFLDQKYNRQAVARLARGRRVLDCFTHTGSFALNAAKGGAAAVTAVDISQAAVELVAENAALNGLTEVVAPRAADIFDLLPALAAQPGKAPYDFIILDPPAFTKSRKTVPAAMRGYKELNYRAMKLLPRGGYLATCSCSHFATPELFEGMLRAAAQDAGVQLRQIESRQQSPDHPILWNVPETNYLKFYLFQVV
ncbi:MAG: class I SAM-dependent rRNA methyltransferase [Angelakisella sp.]|jgi:23S rRNA (cytosine1962-C5)-methyltransferase|nr:class I SAM-dependent rRNA methyltransferase [Angelakisella sp.]